MEEDRDEGRAFRKQIRFFVSPYQRTRETFKGIVEGLDERYYDCYEEPRLREQDFGNFQRKEVMDRCKKEREAFGHFYYRFPGGESGADVYDRMSTFLETLYRQMERPDFPQVVVIVGHGLSARLLMMRWFHWSVESFEALENLRHCEMVVMKRVDDARVGGSAGDGGDDEVAVDARGNFGGRASHFEVVTPLRRWK
ncbi:hypothetical protein HK101_002645 [Irineochytrium annulatum]|nr:hypothetical protein HK101_002645 [Irineochytrium annulatum]